MPTMMDRPHEDRLAEDFARIAGRPILTEREPARLLARSQTSLRQARYRGEIQASRPATNGPVYYDVRELARYFLTGVRRSLPNLDIEAREARLERLERARRARRDR